MGGGSFQGGGGNYLHVTKGKLKGTIAGAEVSYDFYTGVITKMQRIKDEFEGNPLTKWRLHMQDGGEKVSIDFLDASSFMLSFFQRLLNADPNKAITVGVSKSEQNEKVSFCWMKQDGNKIERNLSVLPQPEKIDTGVGQVKNWAPTMKIVNDYVTKHWGADAVVAVDKKSSQPPTKEEEVDDAPTPGKGDLPF